MVIDAQKILGFRKLDLIPKSCFCLPIFLAWINLLVFIAQVPAFQCPMLPMISGVRCCS